jgi:hypothetical protein
VTSSSNNSKMALEDDQMVASSPAIAPNGTSPRPPLQALALAALTLKFVFHADLILLGLLCVGGEPLLGPSLSTGVRVVACVQTVLYAVLLLFSASTTAQGWITFGHLAKVIGAANSGGPFDRGARFFGVRDYSRPGDVGLPHARHVRIHHANLLGDASLGAWHCLPSHATRDVLEAVDARGDACRDEAFDGALRGICASTSLDHHRPDMGNDRGGPLAAIYLHGNFESRAKWVAVEHMRLLSCHFGLHVLAIDYRGFGDSGGGPPTPRSIADDAVAAVEWLRDRGCAIA